MPRDLLDVVRDVLRDRYEIEDEIGHGGAARVYRARAKDQTLVALKVLRPELMVSLTAKRFLREIRMLRRLKHPHIAQLLDFGETDWLVWYVMQFIEGPTLREWLDQHKRSSVAMALERLCEILDAVAHAHEQGIVHRDVKPDNIKLAPHGAVLLDFGIAKAIAASEAERVTRSGYTVGTSYYMSPEQAAGQPIDHRADLYALGCVLFETLAGEPPFRDDMESHVLIQHQRAPVPDIRRIRPQIPKAVARVIEKALAKNPDQRWQSASEFRSALERCRSKKRPDSAE